MALCANGSMLIATGVRRFGATAYLSAYPSVLHGEMSQAGPMRNITAGEGITSELVSIPSGNRHPSAWMMPQKAGALAARNSLTGEGEVSDANIWAVKLAEAGLSGSGDLTAIAGLIVQALADIAGSGEISDANVQAFLAAVASLSGSGEVSEATLLGFGELVADVLASGTAGGSTLTGSGELSADLVVTGTGLSTANVGQAVWDYLIESGFTAAQVVQIIAAVTAGKASGGPDAPVFRNLGDTQDVVEGEADSSGNRTVVTYTPS